MFSCEKEIHFAQRQLEDLSIKYVFTCDELFILFSRCILVVLSIFTESAQKTWNEREKMAFFS